MIFYSPAHRAELEDSTALPGPRKEVRWQESDLWPVRRPYPVQVPCPVCGVRVDCGLHGRQRCPQGHEFGQRAFWTGQADSCWLLVEEPREGRIFVHRDMPILWHDGGRRLAG